MQKPSPAWGWLTAIAAIKCSLRGEDGKERGTLPICGFPARCKCCLVWGRGLGKRKGGKDSPKLLRNWGYIWQHVNQRLLLSTFPLVLLKSLEPLKDPAGCSGTTNCRIEPRWLYLKLSLKWFIHFLNVHHVRRNPVSLSKLFFLCVCDPGFRRELVKLLFVLLIPSRLLIIVAQEKETYQMKKSVLSLANACILSLCDMLSFII